MSDDDDDGDDGDDDADDDDNDDDVDDETTRPLLYISIRQRNIGRMADVLVKASMELCVGDFVVPRTSVHFVKDDGSCTYVDMVDLPHGWGLQMLPVAPEAHGREPLRLEQGLPMEVAPAQGNPSTRASLPLQVHALRRVCGQ